MPQEPHARHSRQNLACPSCWETDNPPSVETFFQEGVGTIDTEGRLLNKKPYYPFLPPGSTLECVECGYSAELEEFTAVAAVKAQPLMPLSV